MKKIDFIVGHDIDSAFQNLRETAAREGEDVCGEFNGEQIDSTMSLDQMYITITGKTKAEFDRAQAEWREKYEREEREHKASIPVKTTEYIKRGHTLLDESTWGKWDECVPIRLGDLYRGMELDCTLELVEMLDKNNCSIDEAKAAFSKQGHSGMSASLMFSMMKAFCKRGDEFVNAAR